MTLQGFIIDPRSAGEKPVSITNGMVLRVL